MIKVKKLHKDAKIPKRKGDVNTSAFIDLSTADVLVLGIDNTDYTAVTSTGKVKQVAYAEGDTVILKTGLAIKLPEGTYAELLPRSSTFRKTGLILTNGTGIIDNAYCGEEDEWMAMFYATRDGFLTIGEDYLQFRVVNNMKEYTVEEVEHLESISRGGYGSTDNN